MHLLNISTRKFFHSLTKYIGKKQITKPSSLQTRAYCRLSRVCCDTLTHLDSKSKKIPSELRENVMHLSKSLSNAFSFLGNQLPLALNHLFSNSNCLSILTLAIKTPHRKLVFKDQLIRFQMPAEITTLFCFEIMSCM